MTINSSLILLVVLELEKQNPKLNTVPKDLLTLTFVHKWHKLVLPSTLLSPVVLVRPVIFPESEVVSGKTPEALRSKRGYCTLNEERVDVNKYNPCKRFLFKDINLYSSILCCL